MRMLLVLACTAIAATARAESWPDLDDLASPRFLLITHCRAETVDGRVLCKVLEVWKGSYSPLAFAKRPPTGYIEPDVSLEASAEVILVYTRGNQSQAGISRIDMVIPVRDGKLKYPPGRAELFDGKQDYTLAEFKRELTSRIAKQTADASPVAKRPVDNLAGRWRMFLPAGFEHEMTIEALTDNRFRLQAGGSRFNGVYELRGRRLVVIEPQESRFEGFVWELRSPYLLTLIEQSEKVSNDYRGAVLFRPSQAQLDRTTK